jgi:hypothetical protein
MAHLHDFFGNVTVDAFSTYQSMRAGATTCPAGDTAGYWLPAVVRHGTKIDPAGSGVREQVYVSADNLAPGTHIEPFPPDLRMVSGNAHAVSPRDNPDLGEEIYWGCSDNSVGGKPLAPPTCASGIISLHVGFPNCWDGVLTHRDDTAHLRHPVAGRCPAGFRHALPRVIIRTEYPVGTSGGTITLSSGPAFTAHGDFWNTWDQAKLVALVDSCLNAGRDCGVFRGPGGAGAGPATTAPRPQPTQTTHHPTGSNSGGTDTSPRQHHGPASTLTRPPSSRAPAPEPPVQVAAAEPSTTDTGSGGSLPFTGSTSGALLALTTVLLGLGGVILVRGRNRPRARR